MAKRYRHVWDAEPAALSIGDPQQQVRAMASELLRRYQLRASDARGTFTDAELWVHPDTWEQAVSLLREASSLIHDQAAAPRSDGTVPVNLTLAAFRMRR